MFFNKGMSYIYILLFFLFSCNKDNDTTGNTLSSTNQTNNDCNLEEILDKYQILAEDFIDARKVNNTTRILNINIEIESLLEPWDSMKDDCNSSEIINAMEKRISIANYMNRGK